MNCDAALVWLGMEWVAAIVQQHLRYELLGMKCTLTLNLTLTL
jgi:hypothetical protein